MRAIKRISHGPAFGVHIACHCTRRSRRSDALFKLTLLPNPAGRQPLRMRQDFESPYRVFSLISHKPLPKSEHRFIARDDVVVGLQLKIPVEPRSVPIPEADAHKIHRLTLPTHVRPFHQSQVVQIPSPEAMLARIALILAVPRALTTRTVSPGFSFMFPLDADSHCTH